MNSSFLVRSTLILGAAVALLGAGCGTKTASSPVVPLPTPPAPVATTTTEAPAPAPAELTATTTAVVTPAPTTSTIVTPPTAPTPTAPPRESAPAAKTYSLQEVAQHKDASSCWTVIEGKVYDLSAWIARHPGGERAILSLCGKDGTSTFSGQHGGQAGPLSALASFQIGTVK